VLLQVLIELLLLGLAALNVRLELGNFGSGIGDTLLKSTGPVFAIALAKLGRLEKTSVFSVFLGVCTPPDPSQKSAWRPSFW
jgi:hypothetical protein